MHGIISKVISVLISLVMLLSVAALPASAQADKPDFIYGGERRLLNFPVDEAYFPEQETVSTNRFYSNGSSDCWHFYDRLTTPQKRIYNALLKSRMGLDSEFFEYDKKVYGKKVSIPFADFKIASTSADTLLKVIDKNVVSSISALMEDYPEFFWVGGYGYGMQPAFSVVGSEVQYSIDELVILLMPNPIAYEAHEWDKIEEDYNYLLEQIEAFPVEGSTRYEKLRSIHDELLRRAEYDYTFELPHAYDPLGVFVEPNDYVCEGYSESFKLICDREGIPCICIVGEGGYGENHGPHKWNYVQMEDGKWYGMDLTWDDQDEILHDYFLVGSDTRSEFFGHHKYIEEHVPSGALFMGIAYRLQYPTLSQTRYYYPDNKPTSADGLWHYKLLDDGTASITSGDCDTAAYLGNEADVTVPSEIDGYTVSEIGTSAFAHCSGIETITLPETVERLGRFCFEDCSVKTVNIPEAVTEIPYGAFISSGIDSLELPRNVEKIGMQAFENCADLVNLTMTDSVTEIGDYAFSGCASLKSVALSDKITAVPEAAFKGCRSLESIELSDGIVEIGASAFDGCASLKSVSLPEGLNALPKKAFSECLSLSEVTVPDTLTSIGDAAFYKCSELKSVIIPKSVSEISKSAFLKSGIAEIYGYTDSFAEQFARNNSIHFIPLDGVDCESGEHLYRSHRSADSTVYECMLCGDSYSEELPVLQADKALTVNADIDYKDDSRIYYALFTADKDGLYSFTVDGDKAEKISVSDTDGELKATEENRCNLSENKTYIIAVSLKDDEAQSFELRSEYHGKMPDPDPTPTPKPIVFPDVKESNWFYTPVQYCAEKGFIKGYADGTFGPVDSLSRQDFVIILARIAGANLKNYTSCKLKDVDMKAYYGPAVAWATSEHIINGYADGRFGVGDPITREQVAVILYGYLGRPDKGSESAIAGFADKGKISSFAKDAIIWAVNNGVITGKDAKTLAPTATASRAEIATMITRMDQKGMF